MKLYIEADAFSGQRFDDFKEEAAALGLTSSRVVAAGLLALFWQDTQSKCNMIIKAPRSRLVAMMPVPKFQREAAFQVFLDNRYIVPVEGEADLFEVKGNQKHIDALQYFQECGRKGGIESQKKRRESEVDAPTQDEGGVEPPSRGGRGTLEKNQGGVEPPLEKNEADQIRSDQIRSTQIRSDQQTKKGANEPAKTGTQLALVQPPRTAKPPAPSPHNVVAAYCRYWKARYGSNPPIGGKAAGQLKTLLKDHGEAKCVKLIEAYLRMPDQWFVTKRHDVGTLLDNLNAVAHFLESGRHITKKEIRQLDDAVHTQNLLEAIDRGEI